MTPNFSIRYDIFAACSVQSNSFNFSCLKLAAVDSAVEALSDGMALFKHENTSELELK